LSPLALKKRSFVTINDILDKIELYYSNFSLINDNKEDSSTSSSATANIGLKKKTTNISLINNNNNNSNNNNNNNNELIDRLYKAKIKIMEESKDILIKRINELYKEQLIKLKEEYSNDVSISNNMNYI